eukprot:m.49553 g.49553  ORF g.49553 m.49553 type:complete len:528 (-) comp7457_c0_seq2:180-1763(-)
MSQNRVEELAGIVSSLEEKNKELSANKEMLEVQFLKEMKVNSNKESLLLDEVEALKHNLEQRLEEKHACNEKVEGLQKQLEEKQALFDQGIHDLNHTLALTTQKLQHVENGSETHKKEADALENLVKDLQHTITKLESDINDIKEELKLEKTISTTATQRLQESLTEVETSNVKILNLEEKVALLKKDSTILIKDKCCLESQLSDQSKLIVDNQELFDNELKTMKEKLENEKKKLSKQLTKTNRKIKMWEEASKIDDFKEKEIHALQEMVTSLDAQLHETKDHAENTEKHLKDLQEEKNAHMKECNARFVALQGQVTSMKKELAKAKREAARGRLVARNGAQPAHAQHPNKQFNDGKGDIEAVDIDIDSREVLFGKRTDGQEADENPPKRDKKGFNDLKHNDEMVVSTDNDDDNLPSKLVEPLKKSGRIPLNDGNTRHLRGRGFSQKKVLTLDIMTPSHDLYKKAIFGTDMEEKNPLLLKDDACEVIEEKRKGRRGRQANKHKHVQEKSLEEIMENADEEPQQCTTQ